MKHKPDPLAQLSGTKKSDPRARPLNTEITSVAATIESAQNSEILQIDVFLY